MTATGAAPRLPRLMAAAESIFLAKGYHTATMTEVAKAAGMSKKTVYTLIDSKAELFAAILEHRQSLLVFPTPKPGWTLREALYANLLCVAHFLLSPEQIAILRLIMTEYTHSPDLGRVFHRARIAKAKSELESCLIDIVKDQAALAAAPKELAAMLIGMVIGDFHLGVLIGFQSSPSRPALERRVRQAVDIFVDGFGNQS